MLSTKQAIKVSKENTLPKIEGNIARTEIYIQVYLYQLEILIFIYKYIYLVFPTFIVNGHQRADQFFEKFVHVFYDMLDIV